MNIKNELQKENEEINRIKQENNILRIKLAKLIGAVEVITKDLYNRDSDYAWRNSYVEDDALYNLVDVLDEVKE